MSELSKVFITGLGAVSALGGSMSECFATARQGQSAVRVASPAVCERLPQALAAAVDNQHLSVLSNAEKNLDRATQLAILASREAMVDSQGLTSRTDTTRIGVFVGVGMAGANTMENLYTRFFDQSQKTDGSPIVMHPLSVPRLMANSAAAALTMEHQLLGPSYTYSVACASSAMAIGEAYRSIRAGYCDAALVVGTEAMLTLSSYIIWNALRVLAKPHVDLVAGSCRPFDAARTGFVLGEGAAALVLESEHSMRRKPHKPIKTDGTKNSGTDNVQAEKVQTGQVQTENAYAEIVGYGNTSDAAHLTAPSQAGQERAMRMALQEAGMRPVDIGYINAHGTATHIGDAVEAASICSVFGEAAILTPLSATKSMHGHMIGAGGAMELALSVMGMQQGVVLPTAHVDCLAPDCQGIQLVMGQALEGVRIPALLSNSFAFGGSNVSLIAKNVK